MKDADKLDEVEAIRRRHEAANAPNGNITAIQWRLTYGGDAHTDRATLLRLLDAARAELVGVREAAQKYEEDTRIFFNRPASGDRLAAALKGSGHD